MRGRTFFSDRVISAAVDQYLSLLKTHNSADPILRPLIAALHDALFFFLSHGEDVDSLCQVSIAQQGARLNDLLVKGLSGDINKSLVSIASLIYRFVVEVDLSTPGELTHTLRGFLQVVNDSSVVFTSAGDKRDIEYAKQELPTRVLKVMLNDPKLGNVRNVGELSEKVSESLEKWDADLNDRETRAESLKEALKTYEAGFNFVGLSHGFESLAKAKREELRKLRWAMGILGCLVLFPIGCELKLSQDYREATTAIVEKQVQNSSSQPIVVPGAPAGSTSAVTTKIIPVETTAVVSSNSHKGDPWQFVISAVGLVSLSLILLYFFRLAVRSADMCKAQLLQIELRKSLCQFIQSYATFSKEIKDKNPDSLAKFESLIFSGIVSSDEKLPTSLDGIEQIGNLVKSFKG